MCCQGGEHAAAQHEQCDCRAVRRRRRASEALD
jgi:hypothetical protein